MNKFRIFKKKNQKKIRFKVWTLKNRTRKEYFLDKYLKNKIKTKKNNDKAKEVVSKNKSRSVFNSKSRFIIFRRFKHYYTSISTSKIIKYYIKCQKSTGNTILDFFSLLERRLDTFLYRSKVTKSMNHARQLISHKKVLINNTIVKCPGTQLKYGDVIRFIDIKDILKISMITKKKKLLIKRKKPFKFNRYFSNIIRKKKKRKKSIWNLKVLSRKKYFYIQKKLILFHNKQLNNYLNLNKNCKLKIKLFNQYFLSFSNNIFDSKLCAFFFMNSFSPVKTKILSVLLK